MDRQENETDAQLEADLARQELEEAEELQWRTHLARREIFDLIEATLAKVDPHVLKLAWGPTPNETDAKARLLCLADRVALFSAPIGSGVHGRLSLANLSAELRAIAHGDKAQITEPAPFHGMKAPNAFRLALHKLRALQWDVFLAAKKHSPAERHNAIGGAYRSQWTAIYRWRGSIEKLFGEEWTTMKIDLAGKLDRFGRSPVFFYVAPDKIQSHLKSDGEAYYRERKRQFPVEV